MNVLGVAGLAIKSILRIEVYFQGCFQMAPALIVQLREILSARETRGSYSMMATAEIASVQKRAGFFKPVAIQRLVDPARRPERAPCSFG